MGGKGNERLAHILLAYATKHGAVAGLHAHSHSHKPGHAWQCFVDAGAGDVPPPLVDAVQRVLALARA